MADQRMIRKTYEAGSTKAVEGEDRTLLVSISTANPDRSKDVVVPGGIESGHSLRNPVLPAFQRFDRPATNDGDRSSGDEAGATEESAGGRPAA